MDKYILVKAIENLARASGTDVGQAISQATQDCEDLDNQPCYVDSDGEILFVRDLEERSVIEPMEGYLQIDILDSYGFVSEEYVLHLSYRDLLADLQGQNGDEPIQEVPILCDQCKEGGMEKMVESLALKTLATHIAGCEDPCVECPCNEVPCKCPQCGLDGIELDVSACVDRIIAWAIRQQGGK